MNPIIIGLILAFIPILKFILIYYYSKKDKNLNLLKKHTVCFYDDWLFVIFNLFLAYTITLGVYSILMLFIIFVIVSYYIHHYWIKLHTKEGIKFFMYDIERKKWTRSGIVHFIYTPIQATLVFAFFFSMSSSIFAYINSIIMIIFFISLIPASKIMHRKFELSDIAIATLGIVIMLIKIIVSLLL